MRAPVALVAMGALATAVDVEVLVAGAGCVVVDDATVLLFVVCFGATQAEQTTKCHYP